MKKNILGQTGIEVSKLCFGGLTIGPLQKNMSPIEGGQIIKYAYEQGINFIDTAQLYGTYEHIKQALKSIDRNDFVIASKSYAYDEKTALDSVYEALDKMGTDYIDLFLLHEQESEHTLRGHYEALETFIKLKEKGIIRAVGLSTHAIAGVEAAIKYNEIEVIHPILNVSGLGITDGSKEEMYNAIKSFHNKGGGVYSMKPLGGGNLLNRVEESFDYILGLEQVDSIAVGMQQFDEIDYNIRRFSDIEIDSELRNRLANKSKRLMIADWCTKCGDCIDRCQQKALKMGAMKPTVNHNKCVTCGYCSAVCSDFCIKVI